MNGGVPVNIFHAFLVFNMNRGVSMLRTHDLVDLTRKGIPDKYRSEIWMVYSGALDLQVTYMHYSRSPLIQTRIELVKHQSHTKTT